MPFELYETLDLGPLKKTKEVFTTADASIVSMTGIAENVLSSNSSIMMRYSPSQLGAPLKHSTLPHLRIFKRKASINYKRTMGELLMEEAQRRKRRLKQKSGKVQEDEPMIALRASQPIDKARPSNSAPAMPDPIVISSDSEEDREKDPKGSNSEEEDPKMDPERENQEVDSTDESEEVPKYILGEGQEENQNLGEEEPKEEGREADHEMDPNQDLEEPEEDP
ncbi:hypothetical protein PIB30_081787 [Stylosanthes scabra]|uniref:Uncharacterized protein n=1 Tax=Stylosanthes scabra TaxID=79078 RepID=A0ABU6WQ33_9FABA|nr:hypothetical protein [Stylosanthes scabra]